MGCLLSLKAPKIHNYCSRGPRTRHLKAGNLMSLKILKNYFSFAYLGVLILEGGCDRPGKFRVGKACVTSL